MRIVVLSLPVLMLACAPPAPVKAGRAVVEVYMHPNGLSRCVDTDGDRWKADSSCCPEGFDLAGFSTPAVTEYIPPADPKDTEASAKKPKRRLYRHVVCIER